MQIEEFSNGLIQLYGCMIEDIRNGEIYSEVIIKPSLLRYFVEVQK